MFNNPDEESGDNEIDNEEDCSDSIDDNEYLYDTDTDNDDENVESQIAGIQCLDVDTHYVDDADFADNTMESDNIWKDDVCDIFNEDPYDENLVCHPCDSNRSVTDSVVTDVNTSGPSFASHMSSLTASTSTSSSKPQGASKCDFKNCNCLYRTEDLGCCNVCRLFTTKFDKSVCKCYYCGAASQKRLSIDKKAEDDEVLRRLNLEYHEFSSLRGQKAYNHIKDRLGECIIRSNRSDYFRYDFRVGRENLNSDVRCCRSGFLKFYQTSKGTVENMIRELKSRKFEKTKRFSENKKYTNKEIDMMVSEMCTKYEIFLPEEMNTNIRTRKGNLWEITKAWLDKFIEFEAEPQPNRRGERHLHKGGLTKKVIWEHKYIPAMKKMGSPYAVKYSSFTYIWRRCYPNVKSRKFLAVPSKCVECALIDYEYEHVKSDQGKRELELLCLAHSAKYKGQRAWYHATRLSCIESNTGIESMKKISGIADGCSQSHTAIPHYGSAGCGSIAKSFDTHLQGVMIHGKSFTLYRSFGNVGKGVNVAIHSWLLELEKVVNEKGALPDTVYMQVDGGPENANATMIGLAELLVHRGVTKRVYITRLPPGHTHEVEY
jgi:hypothetical protein